MASEVSTAAADGNGLGKGVRDDGCSSMRPSVVASSTVLSGDCAGCASEGACSRARLTSGNCQPVSVSTLQNLGEKPRRTIQDPPEHSREKLRSHPVVRPRPRNLGEKSWVGIQTPAIPCSIAGHKIMRFRAKKAYPRCVRVRIPAMDRQMC